MEDWQLEFEWLRIGHTLKEMMNLSKVPDFQGTLFLIGVQELGIVREEFTKEEKQDLMHIAVCRLLSDEGFYEFEGYDADGWPHWRNVVPVSTTDLKNQEVLLKKKIIHYIDNM